MPSKKTSIFLAIACACWLLIEWYYEILYFITSEHYRETILSIIRLPVIVLFPVFLGLTVIFYQNGNTARRKVLAICLAVISLLWLIADLCWAYNYITEPRENFSVLVLFISVLLPILFPISLLLFGIALAGDNILRIRRNAAWLLAGAGIQFLRMLHSEVIDIYWLSNMPDILPIMLFKQFLGILLLGLPFGIILFALSILKNAHPAGSGNETVPSVSEWLKTLLLASIPFAGLILLAIWSGEHEKPIRRNWSLAMFLASIVGTAFSFFVYLPMLEINNKLGESPYYLISVVIVLALIVVGAILLSRHNQRISYDENTDEGNPSVWKWVANFLILAIPLIGIIMLIIWATDNRNKIVKNWALARLIWLGMTLLFFAYMYQAGMEIIRLNSFVYFNF